MLIEIPLWVVFAVIANTTLALTKSVIYLCVFRRL